MIGARRIDPEDLLKIRPRKLHAAADRVAPPLREELTSAFGEIFVAGPGVDWVASSVAAKVALGSAHLAVHNRPMDRPPRQVSGPSVDHGPARFSLGRPR